MPDASIEPFRRLYEQAQAAFNRGDYEAALAGFAPDVVYRPLASLLETGTLHGRAEVVRFFQSYREAIDWTTQPQEYIPAGDGVVIVRLLGTAVGRTTRIENTLDFYEVLEFGPDGIQRVADYGSREEALAAAGSRPDQASSTQPR